MEPLYVNSVGLSQRVANFLMQTFLFSIFSILSPLALASKVLVPGLVIVVLALSLKCSGLGIYYFLFKDPAEGFCCVNSLNGELITLG